MIEGCGGFFTNRFLFPFFVIFSLCFIIFLNKESNEMKLLKTMFVCVFIYRLIYGCACAIDGYFFYRKK